MADTLLTPATAPGGSPVRPRSLLSVALPAPDGWEEGGLQVRNQCPQVSIQRGCITSELPAAPRPGFVEFPPFMIQAGSGCATISSGNRSDDARAALEALSDYALGKMLYEGDPSDPTIPSLSGATEIPGPIAGAQLAVGTIEHMAAITAPGTGYVLHTTPLAAAVLRSLNLIDDFGRSPSGAPWIVSSGYADPQGNPGRIWATGPVFASVGEISVDERVHRGMNDVEAWATRSGIVGFNPCVNLVVVFENTTGGGSDVDEEARQQIAELQQQVADLEAGKADVAHTHAAADVDSGTFAAARIPSLTISKVTGLQAQLDAKGQVDAIAAGAGVTVDNTDPKTPVIGLE